MEQSVDRLQIISVIDAYLAEQNNIPVQLSILWTDIRCRRLSLSRSTDDASLNREYSTITKFIRGHPHLYKFEDGLIQMRSKIHRQCVSETLASVMQSNTWTICHIGCSLGVAGKSNDFKTTTYGKGIQSIRDFMNDHRNLFEKFEPFPLNNSDFMKQNVKLRDANICLLPKGLLKESTSDAADLVSNSTPSEVANCQPPNGEKISTASRSNIYFVSDEDLPSFFEVIDQHLEESLQISELWARVKAPIASCCSQRYAFEDIVWFIANHPHLYKIANDFVSKRSAEHRMVLSELIDYLKTHKTICTKKEIFQKVGNIAHEYRPTVDQCYERELERFFSDHELLFEKFSSDHSDSSKRKSDNTCLRFLNVCTVKERLQTVDSSITISTNGVIQKVYPRSISLLIESGDCAGQLVYCKFADLTHCPRPTDGPYQEGDKVSITAVKRMHRAYQWQATFITPHHVEEKESEGTTVASSNINSVASLPPATVLKKPTVTKQSDLVEEKGSEITDESLAQHDPCLLLALEELRFRLLDSFLRDGYQTIDQIFQQFYDLTVALPNLFKSKLQLQEFIKNRPHLFFLDETGQIISNTSIAFRSAMFDLLLLCQTGQSVEAVRLAISSITNISPTVLVQYTSTNEAFIQFLRMYENIFELSELLPNEDRNVITRGFCEERKRLFLPHWYFR